MKELLYVKDLKVDFHTYRGVVEALDGVTFDLFRGESLGLVGETGCGKSVTSLAILRLIPEPGEIREGKIIFDGENLLEKSEKEMREIRGSRIASIFQDPTTSLNPVFNVGEQISETIITHQKLKKAETLKRVHEVMGEVRIPTPERRHKDYPHEFSGGMKQRIMIAMGLSCQPELLIADEPTTALDVTIQAQILKLMKELQAKFNTSILLITHDLGVVAQTCDRVAVMYAGNVIEIADIKMLFKRPLHPYTKGLLNAIPSLSEEKKSLEEIPGIVPGLIDPPKGCRFHPRCELALEACSKEKPEMIEVEPNHFVCCHLLREKAIQDV